MTTSTESQQLRAHLKGLDCALVPDSSRGTVRPIALKAEYGDDRVHGFTG